MEKNIESKRIIRSVTSAATTVTFFDEKNSQPKEQISKMVGPRQHAIGLFIILDVVMDSSGNVPFTEATKLIAILKESQNPKEGMPTKIGIQYSESNEKLPLPSGESLRQFLIHQHKIKILNRHETEKAKNEYDDKQILVINKQVNLFELKHFLKPVVDIHFDSSNSSPIKIPPQYLPSDVKFSSLRDINEKFDTDILHGLQSVTPDALRQFLAKANHGIKSNPGSEMLKKIIDEPVSLIKSIYNENIYMLPSLDVKVIEILSRLVKDVELAGLNIVVADTDDEIISMLVEDYKTYKLLKSEHVTIFTYPLLTCENEKPINIAFIQLNEQGRFQLNFKDLQLLFPIFNTVGHQDENKMPVALRIGNPLLAKTLIASEKVYRNFKSLNDEHINQLNSDLAPYALDEEGKFKAIMYGSMLKALHLEQQCLQTIKVNVKDAIKYNELLEGLTAPEKTEDQKRELIQATSYKFLNDFIAAKQDDEKKPSSNSDSSLSKKSEGEVRSRAWSMKAKSQPSVLGISFKYLTNVYTVKTDLERYFGEYFQVNSPQQTLSTFKA